MDTLLPRDFAAQEARFRLRGGRRFYYQKLEFHGSSLFRSERKVILSERRDAPVARQPRLQPAGLNSSLAALREAYARALSERVISTNRVTLDEHTGAVSVEIGVQEGCHDRALGARSRDGRTRTLNRKKPWNPANLIRDSGAKFTHKLRLRNRSKAFGHLRAVHPAGAKPMPAIFNSTCSRGEHGAVRRRQGHRARQHTPGPRW